MKRRAFTLIELLVVIGIIVALVALLLPALSGVVSKSRSTASQSNLRQWGVAALAYAADERGEMPWEGKNDPAGIDESFDNDDWWANALPEYMDGLGYRDLWEERDMQGRKIPMPPDSDIWVDPSAELPDLEDNPGLTIPHETAAMRTFFFCYVFNRHLNNTFTNNFDDTTSPGDPRARLSQFTKASSTVLMMELRANQQELAADDVWVNEPLNLQIADWRQFAARHNEGGHMVFADGSVRREPNLRVTAWYDPDDASPDHRTPQAGATYNQPGIVWDPRGDAVNP